MDLLGFMFRNKHVVLHYIPFTHFVLQTCLTSNCTTPWLAGITQKALVRGLLKAGFLEEKRCFGGWVLMDALSHLLSLLFPWSILRCSWGRRWAIHVFCSHKNLLKNLIYCFSVFQLAAKSTGLRTALLSRQRQTKYGKEIKAMLQAELCVQERGKHRKFPSSFSGPSCIAVMPGSSQIAAFQHLATDPCNRENVSMRWKSCSSPARQQ